MQSFDDAKMRIFEKARPLPRIDVAIGDAFGFVLAADLTAPIDLPPFDNSAMDGFALLSAPVADNRVVKLPVSQIIRAGDSPMPLESGTCAKIMTGSALPSGADTVVPIEDTREDGGSVEFTRAFHRGQHVRIKGEDIARGQIAAKSGDVISARHIAFFAALGIMRVAVHRRPSVTVITTGTELVRPGAALEAGQIHDANGPALSAALAETGVFAKCFALPDDAEKMTREIARSIGDSDVLITVGGVSVGDSDHVKACLESTGAKLSFWRVAMKPGKPVAFWTMGDKLIFGLPGNPVSCMVTFELLVKPAIFKMMGRRAIENPKMTAIAAKEFRGSKGKRDFVCGRFSRDGERLIVEPSGPVGSAMIKSLSNANCLVVIPEDVERVEEGQLVEIALL